MAALADALACLNVHVLRLLMSSPRYARQYCSAALHRYDDLTGRGLPARNPLHFMYDEGWAPRAIDERIELPIDIHTAGGTRPEELVILAMVTRLLRPSKIFEIGTFGGRTTSVLRMNAPAAAAVITLDLPPEADPSVAAAGIESDVTLSRQRQVGVLLRQLGLDGLCEQILCNSLTFDPEPYRDSVELGFIDGAHSRVHVVNDTRKMAVMMASRGLVFWHDYGGRGQFWDLTEYLERLSKHVAIHRVPRTTLAWTTARELRKLAVDGPAAAVD